MWWLRWQGCLTTATFGPAGKRQMRFCALHRGPGLDIYIHIYIYIYIYTHTHIYIYIYREREGERQCDLGGGVKGLTTIWPGTGIAIASLRARGHLITPSS